jgi:hypothetical protein
VCWGGGAKGRGVSGDDRIVEVKPQEITGKWEIKPQYMNGKREGANFQNRQATKKNNLASKHTFVALNLVCCTFSAYMLKFQLLLNCMSQKVGDRSNYQHNSSRGRTFISVTCIPFLLK